VKHLRIVPQSAYGPAGPAPPAVAPARAPADSLPPRARLLIAALSGCALLASAVTAARGGAVAWDALPVLALLAIAAERFDIDLYGDSRLSISALFLLTTAIVIGPIGVLMVGPLIAASGHAGRGRPPYKLLFNAGAFIGSGLAAAYVYHSLIAVPWRHTETLSAVAAVVAALADFAVSSVLVSLVIALTNGISARAVWREKFVWLAPHFVLMGFLAFALAGAYDLFGIYGMLGCVAPAVMVRFTMKQYVGRTERTVTQLRQKNAEVQALTDELEVAYHETLSALVAALDLRDTETQGHSARVAELSLQIGKALGIAEGTREWTDLKHGAMLHDVGKVGISDAILRKPGALDEAEWEEIRKHPEHGYNMLKNVRFLATAGELVLCHHERYDGAGYPRGLRGQEIPLAARIFAVADTYDAITSPRPYKAAHSAEAACEEIRTHAGTQFDPAVVEVLLGLHGYRDAKAA
jgi:hypothetical protein